MNKIIKEFLSLHTAAQEKLGTSTLKKYHYCFYLHPSKLPGQYSFLGFPIITNPYCPKDEIYFVPRKNIDNFFSLNSTS